MENTELKLIGYCVKCRKPMKCVDDMCTMFYSADYYECPDCGASEIVELDPNTCELLRMEWYENKKKNN